MTSLGSSGVAAGVADGSSVRSLPDSGTSSGIGFSPVRLGLPLPEILSRLRRRHGPFGSYSFLSFGFFGRRPPLRAGQRAQSRRARVVRVVTGGVAGVREVVERGRVG